MNMQMYFHSCIWLEAAVTLFTLKEAYLKQLSRIGALFVLGKNISFTRNLLRKYWCSLEVKPQELREMQNDFWFILIEAKQKGSTSSTNARLLLTRFTSHSLEIGQKERVAKHWHRLPRKPVGSLSSEVFQNYGDVVLRGMVSGHVWDGA